MFSALDFSSPYCCSSNIHMDDFSLDYWIRGSYETIRTIEAGAVSDSDSDSGSGSSSGSGSGSDSADIDDEDTLLRPKQKTRRLYRPKSERKKLEQLLFNWRLKIRAEDPTTMLFPLDDILPSDCIAQLSRLKPGEPETSSPSSISTFLDESDDWDSAYAREVYDIISDFNTMTIARKNNKGKRPKRQLAQQQPQHAFMSVLDFGTQPTKKRKTDKNSGASGSGSRKPLGELSVNNVSMNILLT